MVLVLGFINSVNYMYLLCKYYVVLLIITIIYISSIMYFILLQYKW